MLVTFLLDFCLAIPVMVASAALCTFVLWEALKHKAIVGTTKKHRLGTALGAGLLSSSVFALGMTLIMDFWWPGWLGIFCFNTWLVYVAQGD